MTTFNSPGSVARAVAKSEIESLFHRYAVLATETPSAPDMAALFVPEGGVFRLPNGVAVKPSELLKVVQGNNPDFIRHHITSLDVQFVSETEARSVAHFFAITHLSCLDHWGQWRDVVRRGKDGPWLIADRSVVVEGADAKGWYKASYPG